MRALEDRLADLARAAYQADLADSSEDCPADEALAALVLGELESRERLRVADHTVVCGRCSTAYRTLQELHREAQRASGSRRRVWLALAAGLAVTLGLVVTWQSGPDRQRPDTDVVRSATGVEVVPQEGARLAVPPGRFSWPEQPEATGYRLELYDATAVLVWSGPETEKPQAALPAEVAGALEPAAYFWVVEVQGIAARPRLGPYWFEVVDR